MKFKEGVIITQNGEEFIIVAAGEAGEAFSGMIKLNKSAKFIAEQLKEETDETKIVEALLSKYDVSEEVAKKSVEDLLSKFRSVGIIKE